MENRCLSTIGGTCYPPDVNHWFHDWPEVRSDRNLVCLRDFARVEKKHFPLTAEKRMVAEYVEYIRIL